MRMCLNRNVLIGLGAIAVAVLLFAPNLFGAALPLLILAICPLSMIFMMRAMSGGGQSCDSQPEANAGRADGSGIAKGPPVPAHPVPTQARSLSPQANGNGSTSLTPEQIRVELEQLEAKHRALAEQLDAHEDRSPSKLSGQS